MKQSIFTIIENRPLTDCVWLMRMSGDTSDITAAGQFVNIQLDGLYLRRPISVFDCEDGILSIIYKVVGKGTEQMTTLPVGTPLDVLTGLGNGYNLEKVGKKPLLVGGGVGVPPLYYLAKKLIACGKRPEIVVGFNTAQEIFGVEFFEEIGCKVTVTTVDGSRGVKGFVTNALDAIDYDYVCTCGPEPMLKALYRATEAKGQYSFEERMGCGFGACMGCSCKTVTGYKRICKDGPILEKEEILWEK
ncbi:MAG: dihydroorotate dehydrogenase electron transfer subunit [Clostridia bacterium]|nr:dihydroorotate dehydrogenase electron transfer subunit [Clostridia bacterium]